VNPLVGGKDKSNGSSFLENLGENSNQLSFGPILHGSSHSGGGTNHAEPVTGQPMRAGSGEVVSIALNEKLILI
jgi:hypothetical protein